MKSIQFINMLTKQRFYHMYVPIYSMAKIKYFKSFSTLSDELISQNEANKEIEKNVDNTQEKSWNWVPPRKNDSVSRVDDDIIPVIVGYCHYFRQRKLRYNYLTKLP